MLSTQAQEEIQAAIDAASKGQLTEIEKAASKSAKNYATKARINSLDDEDEKAFEIAIEIILRIRAKRLGLGFVYKTRNRPKVRSEFLYGKKKRKKRTSEQRHAEYINQKRSRTPTSY